MDAAFTESTIQVDPVLSQYEKSKFPVNSKEIMEKISHLSCETSRLIQNLSGLKDFHFFELSGRHLYTSFLAAGMKADRSIWSQFSCSVFVVIILVDSPPPKTQEHRQCSLNTDEGLLLFTLRTF